MAYIGREPLSGEVVLINSIESQFNGVLTTFNLTRTMSGVTSAFYPISSEQLLVSLGGVIQEPDPTGDTGFRISFNQIIFGIAPAAGVSCFIVCYGNLLDIGSPANNTVSTDKLVDGSVTPIKLSTGGPWWLTNGNVGIGTTNPGQLLELYGNNKLIKVNSSTDNSSIAIGQWDVANNRIESVNRPLYITTYTGNINLGPSNSQVLSITQSSNVGIGTTTPSYKLDVEGSQNVTSQISLWGRTIGQPQTLIEPGRIYATAAGLGPGDLLLQPTGGNIGIGTTSASERFHLHSQFSGLSAIRLSGSAASQIPYDIRQGIVGVNNAGFSIYDVTAAATRFAIDSAGNIGVGIGNPAYNLDVLGIVNIASRTKATTGESLRLSTTDSTNKMELLFSHATNSYWRIQAVEQSVAYRPLILQNDGGNVGIGITNPDTKLDVNGTIRGERYVGRHTLALNSYQTINPASNVFLYSQPNDRDSWIYLDSADTGSNWGIYHRQIDSTVNDLPANSIGFIGGGNSQVKAYISLWSGNGYFSGNVGIGTTNPTDKLHVYGGRLVLGNPVTSQSAIQFNQEGTEMAVLYRPASVTNQLRMYLTGVGDLMTWTSSGNVGIGTANPAHPLHVYGTNSNIVISNASTGSAGLLIRYLNGDSHGTNLLYNPNSAITYLDNTYPVVAGLVYGDMYFRQNIAGTMVSRLTIKGHSGNVGIDIVNPVSKLSVNGETSLGQGRKLSFIGLDINSGGTPSFIKIRTTIPYASSSADFTVHIKGFAYSDGAIANIDVSWHHYAGSFYNPAVISYGSWAPTVRLSNESGLVCIILSSPGYWPKLYVESMYSSAYNDQYATGWTWVDEDAAGSNITTLGYKINFGNSFIMNGSGNVGIGTGTASYKLHVVGTSSVIQRDLYISGNTSGNYGNRLVVGNTDTSFTLQDVNARPTIQAHGAYPVLSLNHTVTSNASHGPTIQFTCNGTGNQFVIGTTGNGSRLDIGTASTGDWNPHNGIANHSGTTHMSFTTSGNVGIGTLSPTVKLQVVGRINASEYGYAREFVYDAPASPDGSGYVWIRASMGGFNGGGDVVKFSLARAIWENSSNPYGGPLLDVTGVYSREWHSGQEFFTATYGYHGSVPGSGWVLNAGSRDLAGGGYWFYMRLWAGVRYYFKYPLSSGYISPTWEQTTDPSGIPTLALGFNILGNFASITASQSITAGGNITAYGSVSDRKLKENINPLSNTLDKVLQLNPVTFDWKKETQESKMVGLKEDIGLIAQEVQEVFPELVREGSDGCLAIRERGLTAILIQAIKEQQKQMQSLKDEIEKMKDGN
jgi:hypothetical protein